MTRLHYLECFYTCVCMCTHTRKRRRLGSVFNPLRTWCSFPKRLSHCPSHPQCTAFWLLACAPALPTQFSTHMASSASIRKNVYLWHGETLCCFHFLFEQTDRLRLSLDEPACRSHWAQSALDVLGSVFSSAETKTRAKHAGCDS